MKNKIQKLPSSLIDQIAAGEVIDRPASVLKELIENSIDAGADKIEIVIQNGGQDLIQISDNGIGMNKSDLQLAFMRHATSKINIKDDLNNIKSLGFRGEALPSIASISMFTAKSSTKNNDGYEIQIHGGEIKNCKPSPSLKGTTCKVENIFYNVPARRKFLKSINSEQTAINKTLRRFMYSHPNISFKMYSNKKLVYDVPKHTLIERIHAILGANFKNNMLEVNLEKSNYIITGYICNLSLIKKRPGEQYIYLNGRFIKDRLLNSGVYSAYQSLIQRGEYPFFILNISMPTDYFDINVHPAKLEARFKNEWKIYHLLKTSTTQTLQDILKTIPQFYSGPNNHFHNFETTENLNFNNSTQEINSLETAPHKSEIHTSADPQIINHNINSDKNYNIDLSIKRLNNNSNINFEINNNNIWQIHNKYLITEIKNGLVIIDQHVAHERILFEEAKKALNGRGLASQTILFPQTLQFQPEEYNNLINITPYLEKIGFKYREFGENTILIEGIPPEINWGKECNIINEILDRYMSLNAIGSELIEQIAAIYACKSAVKAGDKLQPQEIKSLVDRLFSTEHPYYCPHGRPIIINLSTEELDKRFERINAPH